MEYIGWFILFWGFIRFSVALSNTLAGNNLPTKASHNEQAKLSILIPIRNEEKNIIPLIENLTTLCYPNYEILFYDDNSSDKSAELIHSHLKKHPQISIITGDGLPNGWLGKNHACHKLALKARGSYFLFMDADVRLGSDCINKAVAYHKRHKLQLLSIFSTQKISFPGTGSIVPLMNWILLTLLPLPLVRLSSWQSFSAANGQFMLFDAQNYRQTSPHFLVKNEKTEDIAICKLMKKRKLKVATLLGKKDVSCHMYASEKEALEGFCKNIFNFFGNKKVPAYLFLALSSFAPFILFQLNGLFFATIYILLLFITKGLVSYISHQNILFNWLYMPIQQLRLVQLMHMAHIKERKGELRWKGRNISNG